MNEIKNLLNIAFVLLLFLTPLAGDDSFFNSEAKMLILVSILISGITLLDYDKLDARILFISIVILIVLAITVDPFKGLGAAFIYYVSISTFTKDLNIIIKSINILLRLLQYRTIITKKENTCIHLLKTNMGFYLLLLEFVLMRMWL
jgi:hypothetical protein